MAKEFGYTTLIDLSQETPQAVRGHMVDIDSEHVLPNTDDLIQRGTNRRAPTTPIESPAATQVSIPETKPFEEYEDPLTYEIMYERYSALYSAAADRELLCEPCGSAKWETARQQAKRSITKEFLHKPGLPSEFMKFLDIDVAETRELLDDIYFSIPEEVDRDNHVNNFDRRSKRVKEHILQIHEDPDIEEKLQTTIDVWRNDLILRAKIMAGESQPKDKLAHERQTYLDKLVESPSSRHELVHKIGNTLLHATSEEKADFIDKVRRIKPQSEQALGAVSLLAGYLEEYHPAE